MAGAVDRDRAEPGRGAGGAHARSALVFRAGQTPPGVVDREPTASSLPCGGRSASPGNTGDCDPRARRHRARFSAVALIGRCAARAVSSRLSIDARCEVRRKGGERGVTGAGVSLGADAMARGGGERRSAHAGDDRYPPSIAAGSDPPRAARGIPGTAERRTFRPPRAGPPQRESGSTPRRSRSSSRPWRTTAATCVSFSRPTAVSGKEQARHVRWAGGAGAPARSAGRSRVSG